MAKYFNLNSQDEDRNLLNLVRLTDLKLVTIETEDIDKIYGGKENLINWDSMNNLLDLDTTYYEVKRKSNNSIAIRNKEDSYGVVISFKPSELGIKASSKNSKFAQKYGYLALFLNNEELVIFNDFKPEISDRFKLKKDNLYLGLERIYLKDDKLYIVCSLDIQENQESTLGENNHLIEIVLDMQDESIIDIISTINIRILEDFDFELKLLKDKS